VGGKVYPTGMKWRRELFPPLVGQANSSPNHKPLEKMGL